MNKTINDVIITVTDAIDDAPLADQIDVPDWSEMSLNALWQHLNSHRPTPRTTVEAILHCVHGRGVAALKEPVNIARLARCDAHAIAEIDARVAKLKGSG